jgi:hypothetical protein
MLQTNYLLVAQVLHPIDVHAAFDLATFIETGLGSRQGMEVAAFMTSQFGATSPSDLGMLEAVQIDSIISHIGLKFIRAAKLRKMWSQAQVFNLCKCVCVCVFFCFVRESLIGSCPALCFADLQGLEQWHTQTH